MQINDLDSGIFTAAPNSFEVFLVWYGDHWILGTIMVVVAANLLAWPFRLLKLFIRSRNIKHHGWPPEHLDADGDHEND